MPMLPGLNYCLKCVRIDMREQRESTPTVTESDSTMTESDMTAQEWKEKGNKEYKKGNWAKALNHYTNALRLAEDNAEEAVYYKNRAAVYLMLHGYDKAVKDCDMALMIHRSDPKALYRRCQALMELERFEEAYRDAEIIISSYPNNKIVRPAAARLLEILQKRLNENAEIRTKIYTMLDLAFNMSAEKEKRETAMNNLLVLAREKVGAEAIFEEENLFKITHVVKLQKNKKMICSAIRIVGELCKNNISQTESIMKYVGLPWCLEMMNSTSSERVNASQYCLQNILNTYSGMNNGPDSKPDEALCEEHKKEIDTILSCLLNSVKSKTITGLARDAIIQFITRNIYYATLDWAKRLVEFDGLKKLMKVARVNWRNTNTKNPR